MSSSVPRKRIRKSAADRRAEIVESAAEVALSEGLECITLRRIGDRLDVRPGLISHYFPAVDDLVAEAFGSATGAELDTLVPAERPEGTPTWHLARFFARTSGEAYDGVSRLWINARHLGRYRPELCERVREQETAWRERLTALIREGVERDEFRTDDPYVTAIQILVVIDGLAAHANTRHLDSPPEVTRMPVTTAERALGLPSGTLERAAQDPPAGGQPATAP